MSGSRSGSSAPVPGTEWNLTIPVAGPTTRRRTVSSPLDPRPPVPDRSHGSVGTALSSGSPLLRRVGEPSRRALESRQEVPVDRICEGSEVLTLRALLLPQLPLSVTLSCHHRFTPLAVHLTTARGVWLALRRRRAVVLGVQEWTALVSGYGEERANPTSLSEWCEMKLRDPTWKLTLREAVDLPLAVGEGTHRDVCPTVGAVLDGWGLVLRRVSYGAEVPT